MKSEAILYILKKTKEQAVLCALVGCRAIKATPVAAVYQFTWATGTTLKNELHGDSLLFWKQSSQHMAKIHAIVCCFSTLCLNLFAC